MREETGRYRLAFRLGCEEIGTERRIIERVFPSDVSVLDGFSDVGAGSLDNISKFSHRRLKTGPNTLKTRPKKYFPTFSLALPTFSLTFTRLAPKSLTFSLTVTRLAPNSFPKFVPKSFPAVPRALPTIMDPPTSAAAITTTLIPQHHKQARSAFVKSFKSSRQLEFEGRCSLESCRRAYVMKQRWHDMYSAVFEGPAGQTRIAIAVAERGGFGILSWPAGLEPPQLALSGWKNANSSFTSISPSRSDAVPHPRLSRIRSSKTRAKFRSKQVRQIR